MNDARECDFVRKIVSAKRGDRIIYFRGDLAYERFMEGKNSPDAKLPRPINTLANAAYAAYKKAQCFLVQRRVGKNCFEYMAVKI